MTIFRALLVAVALTASACGGGSSGPADVAASPTRPSTFAGKVDLGDGRQVYVRCAGEGSPSVVFENGDESTTGQWSLVIPPVAERTRTCAYDRLGNGSSDKPTGCRGSAELRADLEAVLRAVDLRPPYVLAGTSGGGFLIANFAYAHPDEVAGMLLADTPRGISPDRAPADLVAKLRCDEVTNRERRDYVAVENDAWTGRHRIGDIPVVVISNQYATPKDAEQRTNVADQRGWLVLSPRAKQVVVHSGHDVAQNEAPLVTRELLAMLR